MSNFNKNKIQDDHMPKFKTGGSTGEGRDFIFLNVNRYDATEVKSIDLVGALANMSICCNNIDESNI